MSRLSLSRYWWNVSVFFKFDRQHFIRAFSHFQGKFPHFEKLTVCNSRYIVRDRYAASRQQFLHYLEFQFCVLAVEVFWQWIFSYFENWWEMSVFGKVDCRRDICQVMDDGIWIFYGDSAAQNDFQNTGVPESEK